MKADLSRQTFDPKKRYSGVLMQQGRVLLDSEWNEQQEIHQHRAESGAEDVIGSSGTPIGEDGKATGFEITAQDGKLFIGGGHIYVGGVLFVNDSEDPIPYDEQPHPPNPDDLMKWMESDSTEAEDGDFNLGFVYLDAWERHITFLDDGRIREVALGGPDTTTRKQSVWQVKVMEIAPEPDDIDLLTRYAELRAKSELNESEGEELSKISPRAVKVLGNLCKKGEESLDELGEPPTGKLRTRTKEQTGTSGPCQVPPGGGYERLENQLYRIEMHRGGNLATARFKWSRDNGCLATGIEDVDVGKKEITVKDTGRDEFLSFANGQWVEVVDDHTDLQGRYRQLLQIDKPVDHARRVITVKQTPPAIDPDLHPKLRRWDQNGAANENGLRLEKQELEDGIEVEFGSGEYRAGDYWLIPARTANGDIEWPRVDPEDPDSDPVAQSPHGVRHRFCALALVAAVPQDESEDQLSVLHDCRNLFPPLTRLTSFFYLGGDGQEAMPGKELLEPLRVGVANGQWSVQGARVRFEILDSNGSLRTEDGSTNGQTVTVLTDADGDAACRWTLDEDAKQQSQRVQATLLNTEDGTQHLPICFSANLSVASQVAYDPTDCEFLAETSTVQEAIDQLCRRGGDTPEPGFHVEEVLRISDDAPVRNGSEMLVHEFMRGLRIVCDREVEPETIDPATCFVTLELPWPLTEDERGFFGVGKIVGFQPLILRSTPAPEGAMIFWRPDVEQNFIDRLARLDLTDRMLARLTLKGNFIRASGEPDVYLDGDTFGDPQDELGIRRPTGDGRRGGDFEMYVWLIPGG